MKEQSFPIASVSKTDCYDSKSLNVWLYSSCNDLDYVYLKLYDQDFFNTLFNSDCIDGHNKLTSKQ